MFSLNVFRCSSLRAVLAVVLAGFVSAAVAEPKSGGNLNWIVSP